MSDLAYKLGIGEIKNIHVAEEGGRPVLRIECEEIKKSEYKTVTTKGDKKPEKKKPAKKEKQEKQGGILGALSQGRDFLKGLPGPGPGSEFERQMFNR